MKSLVKHIYIIISILLLFYLLLPNPEFPNPPQNSWQSNEPADTETLLRKAYFTNFEREEVIEGYQRNFSQPTIFNITFPSYRLNYPPEEAQTLIRDQTRSTFLEEIVHPLRESFYVNGFRPKEEKDAIIIEGKNWVQKITVRYIPSRSLSRTAIAIVALILGWKIIEQWKDGLKELFWQGKK